MRQSTWPSFPLSERRVFCYADSLLELAGLWRRTSLWNWQSSLKEVGRLPGECPTEAKNMSRPSAAFHIAC